MLLNDNIILINKLLNLSKTIYKIYNNLYNLEINNKLNQDEYKKNLDYLTICLEIEKDLYKKIDFKKIYYFIEYIDKDKIFRYYHDFDALINIDSDLIIKRRIYNNLNNICSKTLVDIYQNDIMSKNDEPSFDHITFINNEIKNDITKILNFLTQKESNSKYKNNLIKVKYILYFLNNDLNINNNSNKLFLLSNAILYILNINEDIYKKLLKNYFFKYIKSYITSLLNIKDIDYNDLNYNILMYEIIIKSFLELNINNLLEYKEIIYDIINKNNKNNTSIYILKNLLENIGNDEIIILKSERLVLNENSK